MDYDIFLDKLHTTSFHIYGTGIVGISIYVALQELYKLKPVSFLVTSGKGNPVQIEQVPVQEAARASLNAALILVAAPVEHHGTIRQTLYGLGIAENQIIYVDSALENRIMKEYYGSLPDFKTADELLEELKNAGNVKGSHEMTCGGETIHQKGGMTKYSLCDISIYQAKCYVDRPLVNEVEVPACICPIQVGAVLTQRTVADLKDNTGDHISHKNADYCELTATYYAWKNSGASYKGLCHYRRVFELSAAELGTILGNDAADVILPYPTIHLPDISFQHSRYVTEPEWQALKRAVAECEPSYALEFDRIFSERYFYNFNMLVAKQAVFNDYARWLFGILERTEEIIAEKGVITTKRYAGYLGENLTTLYFRKNRDCLKIVHAGKIHLL